MTRAEKVAYAQRRRAEGAIAREIAAEMGCARSTVETWLCDPDLSKQRARRESYRGECVDCGTPTDGSNGGTGAERCRECGVTYTAGLQHARGVERGLLMLELRRAGVLNVEIAERLGVDPTSVARSLARLRGEGLDVPRSPYFKAAA